MRALSQRLLASHSDDPQREHRCALALRAIRQALDELGSLGHPLHLADGPDPSPPVLWPRVMFHARSAPHGREVASEYELAELGPGWFATRADAERFQGFQAQFSGRGGVQITSLPATTYK